MRGFVTLAIGEEKYYKYAKNLLLSYKHNTKNPMPFAVISDKENEYTSLFDKVIIIDNPNYSYLDKIKMLYNPPFDENIFVDADCLAYRDLNDYWDYMPDDCGVVAPGCVLPKDSLDGFFDYSTVGKYKSQIKNNIGIHGGIYFFRNNQKLKKQLYYIEDILEHYYDYKFKYFKTPADEPIIALSMAIMEMDPIKFDEDFHAYIFFPVDKHIRSNVLKGKLSYRSIDKKRVKDIYLLHWASVCINLPKYKKESDKLNNDSSFSKNILYYKEYLKYKILELIFEDKRLTIVKNIWVKLRS